MESDIKDIHEKILKLQRVACHLSRSSFHLSPQILVGHLLQALLGETFGSESALPSNLSEQLMRQGRGSR